jgi:sensor histidine kinase YesM
MSRPSRWLWYGVAWLPVGILWFIYALRTRDEVFYAVAAAAAMMAITSLLGLGIWWMSGRYTWGERSHGLVILSHLAAGAIFVSLIMSVDAALVSWRDRISLVSSLRRSGGLLSGDRWSYLSLYLVSAVYLLAVSVAQHVRAQQRLAAQQLAVATAEAVAAREQLHALRAQLNPHFLYNVLHSLSYLVRHDPAGAEKAIDHLGQMLRYVLDDAAGDEVELEEEWRFVRHYVALESLRLQGRLRVKTEMDPDALDCRIPPFTVQLLVENAIRHGISQLQRAGTVTVIARRERDALVIEVKDDGVGLRPEQASGRTGLGLRALRERLRTRYHGQAAIEIRTAPGAGFDVTVTLPADLRSAEAVS